MQITREMVNFLRFPKEVIELALAPYLEMPTGEHPFVMQHHWRGRSVHVDWRMKVNGYLVGWTVLDNPKGTPLVETMAEAQKALTSVPFIFKHTSTNQGRRAETKARQPLEWMKVHGVTKPGDPGATRENIGVIYKFETGVVIFGVQKPYFHEYFVKSSVGRFFPKDKWFRIVVRRVGVPVLDPETKKPLEKREVLWRVLIPGTQEPYAISRRAMKKNYKPPKNNPYPFPKAWAEKNFPEQIKKWEEWKIGKKEPEKKTCSNCVGFKRCRDPETLANPEREGCSMWAPEWLRRVLESLPFAGYKDFADCVKKNQDKKNPDAYCAFIARQVGEIKSLSGSKFTLHFNSWMGQFVVRGVPKKEWYLRLDDKGSGGVRSFFFPRDPLYYRPTSAEDEGRVDRKWLDFEGKISPRTKYNPNKKIPAFMKIVDKGTVSIKSEMEEGVEVMNLVFNGKKLKGKWRLVQEEKKAPTYSFQKLSEDLAKLAFVLQRHWIPDPARKDPKFPADYGEHWDVRFDNGLEFNLFKNPSQIEMNEEIKARRKNYTAEKIAPWMKIDEEKTKMKVGPLQTLVDPLDSGKGEIFELNPSFISMKFHGKKLQGYYIWKKKESTEIFKKSLLPKTKEKEEKIETTDPETQKALSELLKILTGQAQIHLNKEREKIREDEKKEEEREVSLQLKKKKIEVMKKWLKENQ